VLTTIPATSDFLNYIVIGLIALLAIIGLIALLARRGMKKDDDPEPTTPASAEGMATGVAASSTVVDPKLRRAVEKHTTANRSYSDDDLDDDSKIIGKHGRVD